MAADDAKPDDVAVHPRPAYADVVAAETPSRARTPPYCACSAPAWQMRTGCAGCFGASGERRRRVPRRNVRRRRQADRLPRGCRCPDAPARSPVAPQSGFPARGRSRPTPDVPWAPTGTLRRIPAAALDAPGALRGWAASIERQDDAGERLAHGEPFVFTVTDAAGWYRLTARPLLVPCAVQPVTAHPHLFARPPV